jgi:HK97 family phage major capsid protein
MRQAQATTRSLAADPEAVDPEQGPSQRQARPSHPEGNDVVSTEPNLSSRGLRLVHEAQRRIKTIESEHRDPTADEYAEIEGLLDEAHAASQLERKSRDVFAQFDVPGGVSAGNTAAALSPGQRFTEAAGFKDLFGPGGARGQQWTTGMIDVTDGAQFKGTLGEQGSGLPIGGGAFVSVPQVVPGVVQKLFQPLSIEALLSSGVTDAPTVRYLVEGTATSAAAGVAEGGTKPESTIGFTTTDEPVKKIATMLPVSEELLEDAPAVQAFVNGRLSLFVNLEAERQLFRGAGTNELVGLFGRSVPIYTGLTTDDKPTQLFKAMNSMRGSAFIEPEFVVIHPTDYQIVRLLRDGAGGTAGQYMGGGPFLGPYGGGAALVGSSNQVTGAQDTLWGKPVYVSSAIGGAGTALIGTSTNAQVWNRGGLRVEAANQHSNYFQINLVAIRAERRLALAVYRASGFVETRLAVGPGG